MRLAFLPLLLLASPAMAQSEVVRALCQKTGCDEFVVESAERVRQNHSGILMRTRIKTFVASNRGRHDMGTESGYVFCSYDRPTIIAESSGRFASVEIAPFAMLGQREQRAQTNFNAMYFAVCHGTEAGREAVRDVASTADELGYRTELQKPVTRSLNSPEDVLR